MTDYSFQDLITSPSAFGVSDEDKEKVFPSDKHFDGTQQQLFRGITIKASKELVFTWLCQMRRAPYSYDWIDNLGRKSPRILDPEMRTISLGDRFMYIFQLVEFGDEHFITLSSDFAPWIAEKFYIDYVVEPTTERDKVRLLVKINTHYQKNILASLVKALLPLGDAIMMGKQLKLFKQYAEEDYQEFSLS